MRGDFFGQLNLKLYWTELHDVFNASAWYADEIFNEKISEKY